MALNERTASTAPIIGASQYIHWYDRLSETRAGPRDLAGFIDPPDTGIPIIPAATMKDPIAIPPNGLYPTLSLSAMPINIKKKVSTNSSTNDWYHSVRGKVSPAFSLFRGTIARKTTALAAIAAAICTRI